MGSVEQLANFFTSEQARHLGFDMATGLTSAGSTSQANAFQITANFNLFTTVTGAANSAKLPLAAESPYGEGVVFNADTADNLVLYPASGDKFNNQAANTAITIPPDTGVFYVRSSATSWIVFGGLVGGLTDYLKRSAGDFDSFSQKNPPVGADILLIEDSAAANAKKKVLFNTVPHSILSGVGTISHADLEVALKGRWVLLIASGSYVDADTFTVAGDLTSYLPPGKKLKLTNSGTKYLYVRNSSHSGGTTTVNIVDNSDYTLANAAITDIYINTGGRPSDFPPLHNYSLTYVAGYSVSPTGVRNQFSVDDEGWVTVNHYENNFGTSNSALIQIAAPITSFDTPSAGVWTGATSFVADNGNYVPSIVYISDNSLTINVLRADLAGFTASGNKQSSYTLKYPMAA